MAKKTGKAMTATTISRRTVRRDTVELRSASSPTTVNSTTWSPSTHRSVGRNADSR